jgi:hypothetical protein
MVSAANWLDELGTPPREICLDWAWQIQSQYAENRPIFPGKSAALDWQRIEVSCTGELLMPPDFQSLAPDARLQELLTWAESDGGRTAMQVDHLAEVGSVDLAKQLSRLTASCTTSVAEPKRNAFDVQSEPLPAAEVVESAVAGFPLRPLHGLQRPKRPRVKAQPSHQLILAIKQHKLVVSIVSVCLVLGCIYALDFGSGELSTSPTTASLQGNAANPSEGAADLELDETSALATIPEMPTFEVSEPRIEAVDSVTMPSVSSSLIAGLDRNANRNKGEAAAAMDVHERVTSGAAKETNSESTVEGHPLESADALELKNRDVMQELEMITKSAESKTHEADLDVSALKEGVGSGSANSDALHSDGLHSEPLMLGTTPINQTLKLASKIKVRPRQPVWKIRLSVDDEFELLPEAMQVVSDRQITTWFVTDSDAESPKVRMVIQAQTVPGRQTALRWRVFVGAEDIPDLMLPLDKELLDPLLDRLRLYSQAAQREADHLKQLASMAERDGRAALSKQRTFLETQSKLARRLSTIVAEARLLDDLLRSQLTVHAKLLDGADSDLPALLQFGDPDSVGRVQAEPQPSEVAD